MFDSDLGVELPEHKHEPDVTLRMLAAAKAGDNAAREQLITDNLRLVADVAQRMATWMHEKEDLFQIGVIGLIKAVDRFDLKYDVRFSTYCVPMIIGEIRRYIRDSQPIRASRALRDLAIECQHIKQSFYKRHGYEPGLKELAAYAGVCPAQLAAAQQFQQNPISIESESSTGGMDRGALSVCLTTPSTRDYTDCIVLEDAINTLTEREQRILRHRFFDDRTQAEVGELLGLSQVQVSRLERKALLKIKDCL